MPPHGLQLRFVIWHQRIFTLRWRSKKIYKHQVIRYGRVNPFSPFLAADRPGVLSTAQVCLASTGWQRTKWHPRPVDKKPTHSKRHGASVPPTLTHGRHRRSPSRHRPVMPYTPKGSRAGLQNERTMRPRLLAADNPPDTDGVVAIEGLPPPLGWAISRWMAVFVVNKADEPTPTDAGSWCLRDIHPPWELVNDAPDGGYNFNYFVTVIWFEYNRY